MKEMKVFIFFVTVITVAAGLEMGKYEFISVEEMVNLILMKKGLTNQFIAEIKDDLAGKDSLQEVVKNQEQEIIHLKREIQELKGKTEKQEQRIAALETNNSEMETIINELMRQVWMRRFFHLTVQITTEKRRTLICIKK